jgi:hypothetical protein
LIPRGGAVIQFQDNDVSYLAWIAAHPDGFVLNVRRSADPEYVVLHRASCKSISTREQALGAFTARNFRKICAASIAELQLAAERQGRIDGSFSKRCSLVAHSTERTIICRALGLSNFD